MRGAHADNLLNSEFFSEILADLEAQWIGAWKRAETVETREDYHRKITVLADLKGSLRSIATTGQLERERLEKVKAA